MNGKWLKCFGYILLMGLFQSVLRAEVIQGVVSSIDLPKQHATIETREDGKEKIEVAFKPLVQLKGIDSLDQLEVGDEVRIEAVSRGKGRLEVRAIHVNRALERPILLGNKNAADESLPNVEERKTIDKQEGEGKYIPQVKIDF